jgi:hypothetical protein
MIKDMDSQQIQILVTGTLDQKHYIWKNSETQFSANLTSNDELLLL